MFEIFLTKRAEKALKSLDAQLKSRIEIALDDLSDDLCVVHKIRTAIRKMNEELEKKKRLKKINKNENIKYETIRRLFSLLDSSWSTSVYSNEATP
jgi:mRNA-degrading endonuclease RelE of RelBE toxin-antitoxin system